MRPQFVLMATTVALSLAVGHAAADPDALAKIVDRNCVPYQKANGKPDPCAAVDLNGHYAILKDLVGASQFLLVLLSQNVTSYFEG